MKLIILFIYTALLSQDFYYNNNKKIYLTPLDTHYSSAFKAQSGVDEITYTNQNSQTLKTDGTLIVTLNDDVDLDTFLDKYSLTLIKNVPDRYILVKCENINTVLEISQKIYKDKDVKVSSINFKKKYFKR